MNIPPQAADVAIYVQADETNISDSSDKINEFQLRWIGYSSKLKPVVYSNKQNVLTDIMSFLSLPESWDGHDAIPPYLDSVSNCVKFLNRLPNTVIDGILIKDIIPSNYGTIILDLFNSKQEKVSLEFGKTKIGFYTKFQDEQNYQINEIQYNYNSLPPDLISAITKLYKSYIF